MLNSQIKLIIVMSREVYLNARSLSPRVLVTPYWNTITISTLASMKEVFPIFLAPQPAHLHPHQPSSLLPLH